MVRTLLTGGSGFVAAHVLDALLDQGYNVVFTVRSEGKGKRILDAYPQVSSDKLSFVLVDDVSKEGAFNEAVQSSPPFDYVIHTASPYFFGITDPVKQMHEPAVNGTTNILKAVKTYAPTVQRVVITSSFATITRPDNHAKVYDETIYGTLSTEESMDPMKAYRASKIFAEKAAWDFIENQNPHFDLVTINPPMVFGPVPRFLDSLDSLNTSNHRIRAMIQGETKKNGLPPTNVFLFADVLDVAQAHVRAIEVPQAGGHRFLVTSGNFSNKRILDIIRGKFPELKDKLPLEGEVEDDIPLAVYTADNSKSKRILGIKSRSLEECVNDAVASMLALEERQQVTSH